MKKTYVVMPTKWDYENDHSNTIKDLNNKGFFVPSDIPYLEQVCGALFQPLRQVKSFVEDLKSKWPFVKFTLFEGETWGELTMVEEF